MAIIGINTERARTLAAKVRSEKELFGKARDNTKSAAYFMKSGAIHSSVDQVEAKMSSVVSKMDGMLFNLSVLSWYLDFTASLFESTEREMKKKLDSLVGTVFVKTRDKNGFLPPYNKYVGKNWTFGNEADGMQCVGYAFARFEALTGKNISFYCGSAKYIGNTYKNRSDLELVQNIKDVKTPALAYSTGGVNGHVVVVENIVKEKDGRITVYYTEANIIGQRDGTMKSYVYQGNEKKFAGFVQLKD